MDTRLLSLTVGELEKSLDFIERLLAISTSLVVVGLVLEYWHEVAELVEQWRKHHHLPWKAIQGFVGALLVTVGVAGELALQFYASTVDTALRNASHQVEASLNDKAAAAGLNAEMAKLGAATAHGAVAAAQSQIADANKAAAQAQRDAASEQLARATLEAKISPRRLSLDQQARIGSACLHLSNTRVDISVYGQDPEAQVLATQIYTALRQPGMNVNSRMQFEVVAGEPDQGILVHTAPEDEVLGKCLANAFETIGGLSTNFNSATHKYSAALVGGGFNGGMIISQGVELGSMNPAGPLKAGSPIALMIGVKPYQLLNR